MSLPTRDDFGGGPDAETAWQHFGGKDLEEACAIFARCPEVYTDDVMWMGEKAFQFYFRSWIAIYAPDLLCKQKTIRQSYRSSFSAVAFNFTSIATRT
jgi:hypothetical protein